MLLKRKFELLALQASLRPEAGIQKVHFKLEYFARDDDALLGAWTVDAASLQTGPLRDLLAETLGLPASSAGQSEGLIDVAKRVGLELGAAVVPGGIPLWLHLAKPYGWLGALEWETALEAAIERPVLRLPDFLERARENPDTLDVALCCDLPDGPSTQRTLERAVRAVLDGSPRSQTHVLIFAMPALGRRLKETFQSDPRVWIAPTPKLALPSAVSPWLTAIEQALRERSVDAVHFISRASLMAGKACLRLSDPGEDRDMAPARFPSVAEISNFLNRVGAWAAIFGSPEGEPQHLVRWFADELAQARPGAVLFESGSDISSLYGFLFSVQPCTPPRAAPGFLYCQPSLAGDFEDQGLSRIAALGQNAELFLKLAADATSLSALGVAASAVSKAVATLPAIAEALGLRAPTAPLGSGATATWVAAAQRYVEAKSLELLKSRSGDPFLNDRLRAAAEEGEATENRAPHASASEIVDRTLQDLQRIIASNAPKG